MASWRRRQPHEPGKAQRWAWHGSWHERRVESRAWQGRPTSRGLAVSENCQAAVPFQPDHPGPIDQAPVDPASGALPERRPVRAGPSVARRGKIGVRGIRRQPLVAGEQLLVAEVSSGGSGVDVPVGAVDLLNDEAQDLRRPDDIRTPVLACGVARDREPLIPAEPHIDHEPRARRAFELDHREHQERLGVERSDGLVQPADQPRKHPAAL